MYSPRALIPLFATLAVATSLMGVAVDFFGPDVLGTMSVLSREQATGLAIAATGLTGIVAVMITQYRTRWERLQRARRVFIIYSRKDLDLAKEIAGLLRENNMEPWLDVEQITAGDVWKDVAATALTDSAIALVLITPNLSESAFAAIEVKLALSRLETKNHWASPIIPVLMPDTPNLEALAHIQYVDMSLPHWREYLVDSVRASMKRVLDSDPA